jgi:hypothetical protein
MKKFIVSLLFVFAVAVVSSNYIQASPQDDKTKTEKKEDCKKDKKDCKKEKTDCCKKKKDCSKKKDCGKKK